MTKFNLFYSEFIGLNNRFKNVSLFASRLVIAYGLHAPAMAKFSDMPGTIAWFEQLGIFFPFVSAYLSASIEIAAVVLLSLGLFTRWVSIAMSIVMIVAIFTVHINNGFSVGGNGYEIPLYYLVFFMIFMTHGAGKFSFDFALFRNRRSKQLS